MRVRVRVSARVRVRVRVIPVSGSARRSAALGGHWRAGWWLRRAGGAAQDEGEHPGHGCGREGSAALPLPRAAAVSTGVRVLLLTLTLTLTLTLIQAWQAKKIAANRVVSSLPLLAYPQAG